MAFSKLALLPALGTALTIAASYDVMQNVGSSVWSAAQKTCQIPARKQLVTDLTRGAFPQVDNFFCSLRPFYQTIVSSDIGLGAGALLLSALIPVLMRHGYQSASPNNRSVFLGTFATLLVHFSGRALGAGFALSSLGLIFLAFGSYQQMSRSSSSKIPIVPTPATSVYWSNFALVLFTLSTVAQGAFDASSSRYWLISAIISYAYPVYLAVYLLLAKAASHRPLNEHEARQELLNYSAEQISYAFERLWSYYRKAGLLSMGFYWFGLSRLIRGYHFNKEAITVDQYYLLADYGLVAFYLVATVLIERTTIRNLNPTHPLTGKAKPQLEVDCQRAIAAAPAGNPLLERGTWQPVVAGIIAGPGLAASLWWSGGEEENGWQARKAWREAVAVSGAKKQ